MEGVEAGQASGWQNPHSRSDLALDNSGRASGAGGGSDHSLRRDRRTRTPHRRIGLRLRDFRRIKGSAPIDRLGQAPGARRWRPDCVQAVVAQLDIFERYTAVDDQFDPGDVAAFVARKINRGPSDIPSVAAESQWHLPVARAPHLLD